MNRSLREEQDAAYQESVRQDREKVVSANSSSFKISNGMSSLMYVYLNVGKETARGAG